MTSKCEQWWKEWEKVFYDRQMRQRPKSVAEAAWNKSRVDALEEAALIVGKMKGGYSASLDQDILVPDKDGPWVLNHEAAAAIRALKEGE